MNIRIILMAFSYGFRGLSYAFAQWKLWALLAMLVAPVTPHLRWDYSYRIMHGTRIYTHCTYLGVRGYVSLPADDCPIIRLLGNAGGSQ